MTIDKYLGGLLGPFSTAPDDAGQKHPTISITLLVGGTVIMGNATTIDVWEEDVVSAGGRKNDLESLMDIMVQVRDMLSELDTDEAEGALRYDHVHLVDATIYSGGIPFKVGALRVAIDKVDAWRPGAMGMDS